MQCSALLAVAYYTESAIMYLEINKELKRLERLQLLRNGFETGEVMRL